MQWVGVDFGDGIVCISFKKCLICSMIISLYHWNCLSRLCRPFLVGKKSIHYINGRRSKERASCPHANGSLKLWGMQLLLVRCTSIRKLHWRRIDMRSQQGLPIYRKRVEVDFVADTFIFLAWKKTATSARQVFNLTHM